MGQLALGLRSLLVKAAVFFVMAALLAWVLGGTLFPRPQRVELPSVAFAGKLWHVRLSVGGDRPNTVRYELMAQPTDGKPEPVGSEFAEASTPVVTAEALVVGMRRFPAEGGAWVLRRFDATGKEVEQVLPDRLAVEQALSELVPTTTP